MDNVIPILHGECAFAYHHYGHGDVVVGTINIRVPKTVAQVESMTTFALIYVITHLCRTFHVQYTSLSFIMFYQLSKNPLTISFFAQFFPNREVPIQLKDLRG